MVKLARKVAGAKWFMEDKRDMGIAERIDKSIKASGKSFADVAKIMGVTPTTVWNWARGNTAISVESAARLAETLGVVPAWLTFGEGRPADSRTHVSVRGDAVRLAERRHDREAKALVEGSEWILPRAFFSRAAGADADPDGVFLYESAQIVPGVAIPGDFVLVRPDLNDPFRDGEGHYLLDGSAVPYITKVTLLLGRGDEFLADTGGDCANAMILKAANVVVLGQIVGTMNRLSARVAARR